MDKKTPDDFMVSKLLGEDGDSTVVLGRDTSTNVEYAIKIIDKKTLEKGSKRTQFEKEKEIISLIDHPFFVKLHYVFDDPKRLYFALTFASGGDLLSYIESNGGLSRNCAKHYSAELVLALEYLRKTNIVHRDLKPDTILLTQDMHIKISDFGGAVKFKRDSKKDHKKVSSIHGAANYTAPEVVNSKTCNLNSDLWSLGCITYHMLSGKPIIGEQVDHAKYEKTITMMLSRPDIADEQAMNLIASLLKYEPAERMGSVQSGGFDILKNHQFFTRINWEELPAKTPPTTCRSFSSANSKTGTDKSLTSRHLSSGTAARLSPNKDGTMRRETKHGQTNNIKLATSEPEDVEGFGIPLDISESEREHWFKRQLGSTWHHFSDGALILKMAELDKKRGLSIKTREFILMEGPRLIYVDSTNMELKGEIPWSREFSVEVKSFKSFNISVPGRTYHLVDRKGNALKWCRKLEAVKAHYYGKT